MIQNKIFSTQKTPEEMEKEMKQATKDEMEKLTIAMKNHISKKETIIEEEDFYINAEQDDSEDDSSSEASVSSATNKLLHDITKIKSKEKKGKKEKKQKNNISLIQNVIMVEKLKGEINKLESRIRYKDLDMSNLNLEIMKLNEVQDKYKLMNDILTELSQTEIEMYDLNQAFKNINFNQSSKIVVFQLEELLKKYEKNKNYNNIKLLNNKITSVHNQTFTRLLLDKENLIITEFNNTQLSIHNKINYINQLNEIKCYFYVSIGCVFLLGILWYCFF
jgi:hypothetical protein